MCRLKFYALSIQLLCISGIWCEWVEQQNAHEAIAEMDEGKENAAAFLQPGWFQQEISAFYTRWSSGGGVEKFSRKKSPEKEEASKEKKGIKIDLCWRLLVYHAVGRLFSGLFVPMRAHDVWWIREFYRYFFWPNLNSWWYPRFFRIFHKWLVSMDWLINMNLTTWLIKHGLGCLIGWRKKRRYLEKYYDNSLAIVTVTA